MYCEKCGAELQEGARFCAACGAAVENTETPEQHVEPAPVQKKQKPRTPLIAAAAILVVIIAAVVGVVNYVNSRPTTVNLNDYIRVSCKGYDTMGTAKVYIDEGTFLADYDGDSIQFKSGLSKEYTESLLTTYSSCADAMMRFGAINGIFLDKDEDLSNGDVLTLSWDIDEELLESTFNVKLEYEDITYTVDSLTPVEIVDLFDGFEIEFSGTSPVAKATIVSANEWLDISDYSLSLNSYVKNGDVITVTISSKAIDALLEDYCIIPEATEKTITVSGLDYYAAALDDIPDDAVEKMQEQCEAALEEELAIYEEYDLQMLSMDYLGLYLASDIKYIGYQYNGNYICLVYKYSVEVQGVEYTSYWGCTFKDALVLSDGSFSMDYTVWSVGYSVTPIKVTNSHDITYKVYLPGYETLESLYKNEISYKEEYCAVVGSVEE